MPSDLVLDVDDRFDVLVCRLRGVHRGSNLLILSNNDPVRVPILMDHRGVAKGVLSDRKEINSQSKRSKSQRKTRNLQKQDIARAALHRLDDVTLKIQTSLANDSVLHGLKKRVSGRERISHVSHFEGFREDGRRLGADAVEEAVRHMEVGHVLRVHLRDSPLLWNVRRNPKKRNAKKMSKQRIGRRPPSTWWGGARPPGGS